MPPVSSFFFIHPLIFKAVKKDLSFPLTGFFVSLMPFTASTLRQHTCPPSVIDFLFQYSSHSWHSIKRSFRFGFRISYPTPDSDRARKSLRARNQIREGPAEEGEEEDEEVDIKRENGSLRANQSRDKVFTKNQSESDPLFPAETPPVGQIFTSVIVR